LILKGTILADLDLKVEWLAVEKKKRERAPALHQLLRFIDGHADPLSGIRTAKEYTGYMSP